MTWDQIVAALLTPIWVLIVGTLAAGAGAFQNTVKKWKDPKDDTLPGAFWVAFWAHSLPFFGGWAASLSSVLVGAVTLSLVKGTNPELMVAYVGFVGACYTTGFTVNSHVIGRGNGNGNGGTPPKEEGP